jgi:hypothetical protein
LKKTTMLVLGDPATSHSVLSAIIAAQAERVVANNADEALRRLDRFTIDAAVINADRCSEALVGELEAQGVCCSWCTGCRQAGQWARLWSSARSIGWCQRW